MFLTPKELGLKTVPLSKLDKIVFLEGTEGKDIAEKVYNNTKNKGAFNEFDDGIYLPTMYRIIKENLNENTVAETTIDLARQL